MTHIISWAVYPASELKTVSIIKDNSAVTEITGYDWEKITKDELYKISHDLHSVKDKLENYLSEGSNELFDLDDKIILYGLTNTYFKGQMLNSKIAKFGRSKEKRKDARLIVLAMVINREGFLKYSNIFKDNMPDCKTLDIIVAELSNWTSLTEIGESTFWSIYNFIREIEYTFWVKNRFGFTSHLPQNIWCLNGSSSPWFTCILAGTYNPLPIEAKGVQA